MKPPELNPETESLPTRRSPEGPDPPVLTEVAPPNDSPLDLESVEKKLVAGRYKSVVSLKSCPTCVISQPFTFETHSINFPLRKL